MRQAMRSRFLLQSLLLIETGGVSSADVLTQDRYFIESASTPNDSDIGELGHHDVNRAKLSA